MNSSSQVNIKPQNETEFHSISHHPLESCDDSDDFIELVGDEIDDGNYDRDNDRNEDQREKMELYDYIEKLADGLLSKGWNDRWCVIKNNRFGYYVNDKDTRPKAFVHLNEVDIGIPANLVSTTEYRYCFEIYDELRGYNWFFRTKNESLRNKWLSVFNSNIKHYKQKNSDPTIMELIMMLSILKVKKDNTTDSQSFNFNVKKTSVCSYAIGASVLMELYIRGILDIVNTDEIILLPSAVYTGIGLLDDTIDILAIQLRSKNKPPKISEIIPYLVEDSWIRNIGSAFGDESVLNDPIIRSIYMCVKRGLLEKSGEKNWDVLDVNLEEDLLSKLKKLVKTPYEDNNAKEKATFGIAYVMLKVSTKSTTIDSINDMIDKNKIFPDIRTKNQWDNALDVMHKNLGYFDCKQGSILRALYTSSVEFISKT